MARAALVTKSHGPVEVRDVREPELEPTGMLAEVEAATLCGTDVHFWDGMLTPGRHALHPRPRDRRPRRADQRTSASTSSARTQARRPHPHGLPLVRPLLLLRRRQPADALPQRRALRSPAASTCSRTCSAAALSTTTSRCKSDVIKIPDNVSSPLAASAACALRTCMHGFELLGPIASHETVVSRAPVPSASTRWLVARDRGANRILVHRRARLAPRSGEGVGRRRGPQHRRRTDQAALASGCCDRTGGRGADIVVQCATGAAIPEAMEMTRQGGRCLSIGAGGGAEQHLAADLRQQDLHRLPGRRFAPLPPGADLPGDPHARQLRARAVAPVPARARARGLARHDRRH